jgi:hypothetical protein
MGMESTFYIKIQLILGKYNPSNSHELLARKSPTKLFNEISNYN